MCLAKAYVSGNGEKELLLESVTSIKVAGEKLQVTTLFGEKKEIEARIKEIDFKSSNVILEKAGS